MLNRSKSSLRSSFLYVIINNIRRNFERKGGDFRVGRYPQCGLLPGRLCGVDPFFGVSVELGGLERHGSNSCRHYHGGVYHVPTEGEKEEVAGISGFCRGCFLYTSRNILAGYYVLFSLSSFRRALRNWKLNRSTVPVTAMVSATGSARNTAWVWSASRWGSR